MRGAELAGHARLMAARKILILDDSEICRDVVKVVLEQRGFEVIGLDSPFGFGAALNEVRPDLVLLDAQMPGLSGDKLVQIVLRHGFHRCPIVFYSELTAEHLERLVRSSGASGFIEKRSDGESLARLITMHLRRFEEERFGPSSRRAPQSGPTSGLPESGPVSSRAEQSGVLSVRPEPSGPISVRLDPSTPSSGRLDPSGPISVRPERRDSASWRTPPEVELEPKGRPARRER
jgi:CheY-like chemotaxis protein